MVELGNHQGRPPGCNSGIMPSEASSSLLDHWMNREMNLDFLDQSQEMYSRNYQLRNEVYMAGNSTENGASGNYPTVEPRLDDLRFDSPLSYEKDFFDIEGIALHESLPEFSSNDNRDTFEDFAEKLSGQETPLGFQSWGAPMDIDALKMEEVFQVDQSDLVQGPTLAALNSKDASDELFLDFEFGYDFSKEENQLNAPLDISKNKNSNLTTTKPVTNSTDTNLNLSSVGILSSTKVENSDSDLSKNSLDQSQYIPKIKVEINETTNNAPIRKGQLNQTSRAPTLAPASIVAARLAGRERKRSGLSISSISSMSSVSNDEGFGSQAEDDTDYDDGQVSSDEDSFISHMTKSRSKSSFDINRPTTSGVVFKTNKTKSAGRKKRYFWQYNIQSKGPKVCIPSQVLPGTTLDPHVLDDALDPVFSPECCLEGVKHAGKARRGDGNDLTPCPRKLHNIGSELSSLNDMINDLTPVSDVPFNARPKSRKEKNKLASRACRLKKKAQHEANKLKLYGLQKEQRMMVTLIPEVRQLLRELLSLKEQKSELRTRHFQDALDKLLSRKNFAHVAGNTADFVNRVLDKVASGDPNGGLNDL